MSSAEHTTAAAERASEASVASLIESRGETRGGSGDPFGYLPAEIRDHIFSYVESYRNLRSITDASPAMGRRSLANPKPCLLYRLHHALGSVRRFKEAYIAHRTTMLRNSGPWAAMYLRALLWKSVTRPGPSLQAENMCDLVEMYGECTTYDLVEMTRFYRSVVRPRSQELRGTADQYEYVSSLYHFELWCNYYGSGKYALDKRPKPSRSDLRRFMLICNICDVEDYVRLMRVSSMIGDVYRGLLDRFILLHQQQSDKEEGRDHPQTVLERPEWFAHIQNPRFSSYVREAMASRGLGLLYHVVTDVPEGRALDEIVKREVAIALRGFDVKDSSLGPGLDWQGIWRVSEQLELRGVNRFDAKLQLHASPWAQD